MSDELGVFEEFEEEEEEEVLEVDPKFEDKRRRQSLRHFGCDSRDANETSVEGEPMEDHSLRSGDSTALDVAAIVFNYTGG